MAKRIDDSHSPYKRTNKEGPGPRGKGPVFQSKDWECAKGKNTAKAYVQLCRYVGPNPDRRGAKLTVKTPKARKKAYNKLYRKWAAKSKRIQGLRKRGAKPGYKCRKTKNAKCK